MWVYADIRAAVPGEIEAIRAHLIGGNRVVAVSEDAAVLLTSRNAPDIVADGDGYRVGKRWFPADRVRLMEKWKKMKEFQ